VAKLALHLPPFSPDYSGVCSALFELGGLVVIHDASGCTGNYTGYDEPRWYGSKSLVYCSNLRELDVVMGRDDMLVDKVLKAVADTSPRFIAVLGSPVPMLIGTDMPGIASEIQAQVDIPCFGFNTTGLTYYDMGVSEALLAFAKAFVIKGLEKISGRINLLGATPLDFGASSNIASLKELLEKNGFEVGACFAMGSDFESLCNASSASANLVLTNSGLALAEYFYRRLGTPYSVGLPIGTSETERIITELRTASTVALMGSDNGSGPIDSTRTAHAIQSTVSLLGQRVLIIYEQIIANSLRACLKSSYGCADISVITPFRLSGGVAQVKDRSIDDEHQLVDVLKSDYDIVIADPLFAPLIAATSTTQFIPLPHLAVSSKLYWDDSVDLIGSGFNVHLSAYISN
jgi:hypothetical protein